MKEIVKLIDLRTCDMTLSEVMAFIDRWKAENPGKEIWLDGDAYAIVTEKDEPGKLDRRDVLSVGGLWSCLRAIICGISYVPHVAKFAHTMTNPLPKR